MVATKEKLAFKGTGEKDRKAAFHDACKETVNLGFAEAASIATSMGVVALSDKVNLKGASSFLGRIIEPYIEGIEKTITTITKIGEFQPNDKLTKPVRAHNFAKASIIFIAAFAASMVAKIGTRKVLNAEADVYHDPEKKTGNWFKDKILFRWLNKHDWKVFLWDEGVHGLLLLALNRGIPKSTELAIDRTADKIHKYGGGFFSQEGAKRIASMGYIWEVPNAGGWLAGAGAIFHSHLTKKPKSFVEQVKTEPSKNVTVPSSIADKTYVEKTAKTPSSEPEHSVAI